jgi:hypothetical protein
MLDWIVVRSQALTKKNYTLEKNRTHIFFISLSHEARHKFKHKINVSRKNTRCIATILHTKIDYLECGKLHRMD